MASCAGTRSRVVSPPASHALHADRRQCYAARGRRRHPRRVTKFVATISSERAYDLREADPSTFDAQVVSIHLPCVRPQSFLRTPDASTRLGPRWRAARSNRSRIAPALRCLTLAAGCSRKRATRPRRALQRHRTDPLRVAARNLVRTTGQRERSCGRVACHRARMRRRGPRFVGG